MTKFLTYIKEQLKKLNLLLTKEGKSIKEEIKENKKTPYKLWYLDALAVIAVLLIVFLIVFNLPSNRFSRAINAADKLYYKESYQEAKAKYIKAEKIDGSSYRAALGEILSLKAGGADFEDGEIKDTSSKDTSSNDTSSKDTSSKDTSSNDTSSKDTSSNDTSSKDTSSNDTSSKDTSSNDISSNDVTSNDVASEDASSNDAVSNAETKAKESIEETYISVFERLAGYGSVLKESTDFAIDFFLLIPEIIENTETRVDYAKQAYELLPDNSDIKTMLADAYYAYGTDLLKTDKEKALEAFDETLSLSDNAESYTETVSGAVLSLIDAYISTDDFDKSYSLLDKYSEQLSLNYDEVKATIDTAENLYQIKNELLSNAENYLKPFYAEYSTSCSLETVQSMETALYRGSTYDFSGMLSLDGSNEAETLALSGAAHSYIYTQDGYNSNFTGTAAGLYLIGEQYTNDDGSLGQGYYFYYGDYVNGIREGYGIIIIKLDDSSYEVFEGTFKDDKPEGFGILYENGLSAVTSQNVMQKLTYGNFTGGLENGEMTVNAVLGEYPDTYFTTTYTADNGKVAPLEGELIDYNIVSEAPAGTNLSIIIPCVEEGDEFFIPIYLAEDSLLGVTAFTLN